MCRTQPGGQVRGRVHLTIHGVIRYDGRRQKRGTLQGKSKKNAFGPRQWDHPIQHSEKESQRPGAGSAMYRFDSNPRETTTKAREPTNQRE